jgi:hypothetical protein
MSIETIHIYLLNEGVDVWRPVAAKHLGNHLYQIIDPTASDEAWQFNQGDTVRCELRRLSGGDCMVAIEKSK